MTALIVLLSIAAVSALAPVLGADSRSPEIQTTPSASLPNTLPTLTR